LDRYSWSSDSRPEPWYLRRMLEVVVLAFCALFAILRPRHDLVLKNLVLRHQLQVALRTNPRPVIRHRDRILWFTV
jgi:hypothetical protein